jgi:hypothetical protein
VRVDCGDVSQWRQIKGGSSYLSTNERHLHFGLGDATGAERVEILWPSGLRQELSEVAANQTRVLIEPVES